MDSTKKKVPMILSLALISLALVDRIYILFISFSISNIRWKIIDALTIIALIAAFMYVFTEYKKTSSKYFKFFLSTYSIMMLGYMLDNISDTMNFDMFFELLAFILLFILLVLKDLGKKNSIIISFSIIAIDLALTVAGYFANSEIPQFALLLIGLSRLSLSAVLVIMMFLKYRDKQMRGTK